ncbi:MAG: DUF6492 family protein [Pseudomonadota bacterium]
MKTVLVTPSYRPDIRRCELMLESAANHVRGFERHLLLIDAVDEKHFRALGGNNVEIILKEDLLPTWIRPLRLSRKWWWSTRTLPVRGWILQQVTKLAVADAYPADAFCFADSDLVFVRPFDAESLWREQKLRFYRDERKPHFFQSRRYRNWYGFAARQFDLGNEQNLTGAYIAQLNTLHATPLLAMLEKIEAKWQRPWRDTLLRAQDFSEFVLYGVFVDHHGGEQWHYRTHNQLCHSSWLYDINSADDLNRFQAALAPDQVAIHLQSNLGLKPEDIRRLLPPR